LGGDLEDKKIIYLKSKATINTSKILYIKSDGHYVEYYLDDRKKPEIDRNTMIEVEKNLPTQSFLRIHKSYIVNINRVKIINSSKVMLDTGEWINLSRVYKQSLKDILNKE
jgi:DNA-binding LytR/AlgR family response regulator